MSTSAERLKDEIAILEYRAGNVDALGGLISRWQARIHWYLIALLQDQEAAWDVSQEVWLAAISGFRKRVRVQTFAAWLYRVAHNKAISHLRRKKRLDELEESLPEPVGEAGGGSLNPVLAAEEAGAVRECLLELPLGQREVLSLFYMEDLSLEEIAGILDLPKGTVQSRLHYGRMRMKEALMRKGHSHESR